MPTTLTFYWPQGKDPVTGQYNGSNGAAANSTLASFGMMSTHPGIFLVIYMDGHGESLPDNTDCSAGTSPYVAGP
jgi:hypothetical protein